MAASSQSTAHDAIAVAPLRSNPALSLPVDATSPLAFWHLLSLDAPMVAALWVAFIARAAHIALPWTASAAMFLAVWILYAADRLLDARAAQKSPDPGALEARHHFHENHREAFVSTIVVVTPALLLLLRDVPLAAIRLYLLLGALLLAWLLLIHLPPATARLPKEFAVGIFFPAAVFIPTVARAPWLRPILLPEAVFFAAVCSLNCLYIFAWEHPSAAQQAHWSTRWAVRHLQAITAATIAAAGLFAAFGSFAPTSEPWHLASLPVLASALSAALLLWLNRSRTRLSSTHLRAAADLCLLTPLLLLPVLK